jgi:hypothetical protein
MYDLVSDGGSTNLGAMFVFFILAKDPRQYVHRLASHWWENYRHVEYTYLKQREQVKKLKLS